MSNPEWVTMREARNSNLTIAGMGALRIALLFGSAAVALAIVVAPVADRHVKRTQLLSNARPQVDTITTGSIGRNTERRYVIRRSILQDDPATPCIVRDGDLPGKC